MVSIEEVRYFCLTAARFRCQVAGYRENDLADLSFRALCADPLDYDAYGDYRI